MRAFKSIDFNQIVFLPYVTKTRAVDIVRISKFLFRINAVPYNYRTQSGFFLIVKIIQSLSSKILHIL